MVDLYPLVHHFQSLIDDAYADVADAAVAAVTVDDDERYHCRQLILNIHTIFDVAQQQQPVVDQTILFVLYEYANPDRHYSINYFYENYLNVNRSLYCDAMMNDVDDVVMHYHGDLVVYSDVQIQHLRLSRRCQLKIKWNKEKKHIWCVKIFDQLLHKQEQ